MEFASAALVVLAARELARQDPSLVPGGFVTPDPLAGARATAAAKRALLDHAYARGGPEPILAIGRGLRHAGPNPVLSALLASAGPRVLAEKWRRLERYGHSRNRVAIRFASDTRILLRRHATEGPPPTLPETLLIVGVLAALFEAIGCQGLRIERPGSHRRLRPPARRWSICWVTFRPVSRPALPAPAVLAWPEATAIMRGALRFLAADPARSWSVAELAEALRLSSRSLQRRLAEAGATFRGLVRAVRVDAATRLLRDSGNRLTDIGYACGFADSAHFSRDFKRATGLPPSAYRDLECG